MKRIWCSLILLGFLMYPTTGGATGSAGGGSGEDFNRIPPSNAIYGQEHSAQSLFIQRRGNHGRLRPTDTMPEAITLYEQARANLAAQ